MTSTLRELITDLKAAVLIGDPESVLVALERIRSTPDDALPPSAILPLAEVLALLPADQVVSLLDDEDTLLRGAAAGAAARLWLNGADLSEDALLFAADDPAHEVREALAGNLSDSPDQAESLVGQWLDNSSTNVQQSALVLLQRLPRPSDALIARLSPLDGAEDRNLRTDLVNTLNALGGQERGDSVLPLLQTWAERPEPNVWVITRVLSASWAADHSEAAIGILERLAQTAGPIRPILRAIERHQS